MRNNPENLDENKNLFKRDHANKIKTQIWEILTSYVSLQKIGEMPTEFRAWLHLHQIPPSAAQPNENRHEFSTGLTYSIYRKKAGASHQSVCVSARKTYAHIQRFVKTISHIFARKTTLDMRKLGYLPRYTKERR